MINGILVIYKEKGFTSFDVIAKLRGILKQKKIGHTGTLDPDAVGVLPVCIGNATKLCDMLTDKKKEYIAEFVLGKITDTQDISGTILEEHKVNCKDEDVKKVITEFIGDIKQIPPMYSAIKIDGKRLYELAREGKEVERKERSIRIDDIEILSLCIPNVKIRVKCSKGTYIRTLCHDIGQKLSCGATMTSLERTQSGTFTKDMAFTLKEVEELRDSHHLMEHIMPVDSVFSEYPALFVGDYLLKKVLNGNLILRNELMKLLEEDRERNNQIYPQEGDKFRIYVKNDDTVNFLALYEFKSEKDGFIPMKMFLSI